MIKNFLIAAAFAVLAPIAASAATITGQLDISGIVNLNTSTFSSLGNADLEPTGTVVIANGDFAGVDMSVGAVSLTDVDFTSPGQIWSVGGFTFVATSFFGFLDTTDKAFSAWGTISAAGFDDTAGLLTFTAQENNQAIQVSFSTTTTPVPLPAGGLMLLTALGGFGALSARRRRKAKAAAAA